MDTENSIQWKISFQIDGRIYVTDKCILLDQQVVCVDPLPPDGAEEDDEQERVKNYALVRKYLSSSVSNRFAFSDLSIWLDGNYIGPGNLTLARGYISFLLRHIPEDLLCFGLSDEDEDSDEKPRHVWVYRDEYPVGLLMPIHTSTFSPKLLAQAESGSKDAQYQMGVCYESGQGVPQDDDEAMKWFRLAAEQRHVEAQCSLGVNYALGAGVEQDHKEAVKWFRLAAEQRYEAAQFFLGVTYAEGNGVEQDHKEAAKWYRLAAEQGYENAQLKLGIAYSSGEGVPQDYKEAAKWLRLAAEQGCVKAQSKLGIIFTVGEDSVPKDYKEAVKWLRLAAEQGEAIAQFFLGAFYIGGRGLPEDMTEAVITQATESPKTTYNLTHGLAFRRSRETKWR